MCVRFWESKSLEAHRTPWDQPKQQRQDFFSWAEIFFFLKTQSHWKRELKRRDPVFFSADNHISHSKTFISSATTFGSVRCWDAVMESCGVSKMTALFAKHISRGDLLSRRTAMSCRSKWSVLILVVLLTALRPATAGTVTGKVLINSPPVWLLFVKLQCEEGGNKHHNEQLAQSAFCF